MLEIDEQYLVNEILSELVSNAAEIDLAEFTLNSPEAMEAYRIIQHELPKIGLSDPQLEAVEACFQAISALFMKAGADCAVDYLAPSVALAVKRVRLSEKQRDSGRHNANQYRQKCIEIAKDTWEKHPQATSASLANKINAAFVLNGKKAPTEKTIRNWFSEEGKDFQPKVKSKRNLAYELVIKKSLT